MKYTAAAETDVGSVKETNEDSVLIKHGTAGSAELLLAVICDGMGGLAKGELASAAVIREFSRWFDERLPYELDGLDLDVIAGKWSLMLRDLNVRIQRFGKNTHVSLGTTFTGVLFADDEYVAVHVGDTRLYHIGGSMTQLTEDQTYVAREIKRGNMTPEEAKTHKMRNVLLQCIGASRAVEPQVLRGKAQPGAYLLCSDGFRHEITPDEMLSVLDPRVLRNKSIMRGNLRLLIDKDKERGERDNISAVIIKSEQGEADD